MSKILTAHSRPVFIIAALFALSVASKAQAKPAPLSLDQVLKQIDLFYPKLAGARLELDSARAKQQEKRGAFDPVFTLESDYLRYNSTTTRGKSATTEMSEAAVEFTTPSGAKYFVGSRLNLGKVKSPNSSTGDLGEYYVGIKVPLLRNAGLNEKSVGERQARLGIPLAEQNIAGVRLETLRVGGTAYWEWVAAGSKLTIAANLLKLAVDRADLVRRRIERDDLRKMDQKEADAEVLRRTGNLQKAERDLQKAGFKLSLYLWEATGQPSPDLAFELAPSAWPEPTDVTEEETKAARITALSNRPEFKGLSLVRNVFQLGLELAQNDRKPSLDFVLSPGLDTGANSIGDTLKAGIFYSIPLVQNTADGRIRDARLKLQKVDFERQQLSQTILTEVNDAASAIHLAYLRYLSAKEELAQTRGLEIDEGKLFAAGDGTLFLINQRERARAEAEARVIDVLAEYQQARVNFDAATAKL